MRKSKKLCIVSPALTMGGMERASSSLANTMHDKDVEVLFISLFKKPHFFTLKEGILLAEPTHFNIHHLSIIKTLKWLRRTVTQFNPDSILVYGQFYGALALLSLIGMPTKIFVSERSSPLLRWPLKQSVFNRIIYFILKPVGMIAQTGVAKFYQQKYYGKKVPIHVVPNAVRDIKTFPEIKREKIILAVGRPNDRLKGFDLLITAFSVIRNKDWKLIIAGSNHKETSLTEAIQKHDLSDRVVLPGKVKDMDELYARSGIFVIPSRSEGFPNALCEAKAAGLPCISFDFMAGPRDIITHEKDGIIVPPEDTDALAKAIDRLIENPELRRKFSSHAAETINKFHPEVIRDQLIQILFEN